MAPTSPNPYISRKLNNMDQAQVMKKEREDWTRLYHKTLKGIKAMIDVQRIVKDMKKIVEETNTTMTEMEGTILTASINNRTLNATNIIQMLEDLQYLVQSDIVKIKEDGLDLFYFSFHFLFYFRFIFFIFYF